MNNVAKNRDDDSEQISFEMLISFLLVERKHVTVLFQFTEMHVNGTEISSQEGDEVFNT